MLRSSLPHFLTQYVTSKQGCVGATPHEPGQYDTLVCRITTGPWMVTIVMIMINIITIEYVAEI